ncbi:hypothetical protein XENORESO_012516 [Xenotaenia resolanae]|uniref:Uncharacterized protein n=1 Tax=Xenotaenia resolanae TaxID=208358 RepID=A0ABV0X055_9TELE
MALSLQEISVEFTTLWNVSEFNEFTDKSVFYTYSMQLSLCYGSLSWFQFLTPVMILSGGGVCMVWAGGCTGLISRWNGLGFSLGFGSIGSLPFVGFGMGFLSLCARLLLYGCILSSAVWRAMELGWWSCAGPV